MQFGDKPSRSELTMSVRKQDDDAAQMFVFFAEDPKRAKVGVAPIRTYVVVNTVLHSWTDFFCQTLLPLLTSVDC